MMKLKNIKHPIFCDIKSNQIEAHIECEDGVFKDVYKYDKDQVELAPHTANPRWRYVYSHTEAV